MNEGGILSKIIKWIYPDNNWNKCANIAEVKPKFNTRPTAL